MRLPPPFSFLSPPPPYLAFSGRHAACALLSWCLIKHHRGWKPVATEPVLPGPYGPPGRCQPVPTLSAKGLKRVGKLEREVPTVWRCCHWFCPNIWLIFLGTVSTRRKGPLGLRFFAWSRLLMAGVWLGVPWTP